MAFFELSKFKYCNFSLIPRILNSNSSMSGVCFTWCKDRAGAIFWFKIDLAASRNPMSGSKDKAPKKKYLIFRI